MSEFSNKEVIGKLEYLTGQVIGITETLSIVVDQEYQCHNNKFSLTEDIKGSLDRIENRQEELLCVQKETLVTLQKINETLEAILSNIPF
ncbi:MAG: hypothetical protein F6K50_05650 [Moorea sp. SIO3I7]|nr:hypothetical protein [Moorena sp. SIO3I7]